MYVSVYMYVCMYVYRCIWTAYTGTHAKAIHYNAPKCPFFMPSASTHKLTDASSESKAAASFVSVRQG